MPSNDTIFIVRQKMNTYLCPMALVIGVLGCLFNILLFSQKQFRTISCCICKLYDRKKYYQLIEHLFI
jgi:hypothetical protein